MSGILLPFRRASWITSGHSDFARFEEAGKFLCNWLVAANAKPDEVANLAHFTGARTAVGTGQKILPDGNRRLLIEVVLK